jgi:hypothetical protein
LDVDDFARNYQSTIADINIDCATKQIKSSKMDYYDAQNKVIAISLNTLPPFQIIENTAFAVLLHQECGPS